MYLRLPISLQLLDITMRCDMRDKGESEEQSGFGSHCEEKKNIYSVKAKGFQSMKAECKKKKGWKKLECKEREVCETE